MWHCIKPLIDKYLQNFPFSKRYLDKETGLIYQASTSFLNSMLEHALLSLLLLKVTSKCKSEGSFVCTAGTSSRLRVQCSECQ